MVRTFSFSDNGAKEGQSMNAVRIVHGFAHKVLYNLS